MVVAVACLAPAKAPEVEWARTIGGKEREGGKCIQKTYDGNYVIVSEKNAIKESINAKSFKTKSPKTIPPKSDKSTFREYSAKAIASKDGISDRAEGSMSYLSKFVR